MKELGKYLNPMARLGIRRYSVLFPLSVSLAVCILSETYCYSIAHNPMAVGAYIIFVNVACILYFAFRDGILGGLIATVIPIFYYFYIIYSRHYTGTMFSSGIETTIILFLLYGALAFIIGWLKEAIDKLIDSEKESRYFAEEREIRLQAVLEQLPVGVLLVNLDQSIVANKQMKKMIGKKIKSYLEQDKNYISTNTFINQEPLVQSEWPIVRAIKTGEIVKGEEIEFIRDDKKRLYLRVNAAPIRNKNAKVIAAVSTIDDITHEKDLEQRKDDFVNMASHELKTPLTSMRLYIDSLTNQLKKHGDEKAQKTIASIERQAGKLQQLVSDLLDVSRIQTGKLFFTREFFNLNELIGEAIEMVDGMTDHHTFVFKGEKALKVYADRFRISQVMTNFLTNAVKYSPDGGKIILKASKGRNKITVSVQDFGIGISKEQQKKIFERLYQVSKPQEKTFPGLGMGLYISKEIIKKHKGDIWVEGEEGKGATFYFSLPVKKQKAS